MMISTAIFVPEINIEQVRPRVAGGRFHQQMFADALIVDKTTIERMVMRLAGYDALCNLCREHLFAQTYYSPDKNFGSRRLAPANGKHIAACHRQRWHTIIDERTVLTFKIA